MMLTRINENLLEINGADKNSRYRVERGPIIKTAIATPELLSNDVTASHYYAGGIDATGKPIVVGEAMVYADWKGDHEHKVYHLVFDSKPDGQWVKIGERATEELAVAFVQSLLNA